MTIRKGACLCGAVHYTLALDPIAVRVCWCRDCQRLAANGTVNMIVPVDALEVRGTLAEFVSQADSGNTMRRRFCPQCGTHLFSHSSGRPQFVVVRVGTLDEPSSVHPTTNIWTRSAPAWACLDAQLDAFATQPPPPTPPPT